MTAGGGSPAALLTGIVVGPDGNPAASATVFLAARYRTRGAWDDPDQATESPARAGRGAEAAAPLRDAPFTALTDALGRYAFAASVALRGCLRDGVQLWACSRDLVAPKVILRPGALPVRVPDLTLAHALRPTLRLLTRDGEPVVDAYVGLSFEVAADGEEARPELSEALGARTDAAGIARMPPIPDRFDWKVSLDVNPRHMPRHHLRRLDLLRLRRDEPVEIRIRRGCTIRGRVELADGSPGARVLISSGREICDPDPNWGHGTEASEDGSFLLQGVPTRRTIVVFRARAASLAPGSAPLPGRTGPAASLTLRPRCKEGTVLDLGTVRFELGTISGVVLGPDGLPARAGYVRLDEVGVPHPIAHDGSFVIRLVESGPHALRARIHAPSEPLTGLLVGPSVEVPSGAADVVLHVTGAGNLILRFHSAGQPDRALEVGSPRLFGDLVAATWEGRHAEIRTPAPPGWCRGMRVEAEGHAVVSIPDVEVLADRATVIDVTLGPSV